MEKAARRSPNRGYFSNSTSPTLALVIVGLFGLRTDAREYCKRAAMIDVAWVDSKGWRVREEMQPANSSAVMVFGARSQPAPIDRESGLGIVVEVTAEDASTLVPETSRASSSLTLDNGSAYVVFALNVQLWYLF